MAPIAAGRDGDPAAPPLARIVVPVDGSPVAERSVAGPAPPPYRTGRPQAGAGATEDPEALLTRLVQIAGVSDSADTRVVDDPVGVRDGLLRLVDRTTALLVMGSHRRVRPLRAVLGREAARVVHGCVVPVLVVPLPAGS